MDEIIFKDSKGKVKMKLSKDELTIVDEKPKEKKENKKEEKNESDES